MRQCPKCGSSVQDNFIICIQCGNVMEPTSDRQPPAQGVNPPPLNQEGTSQAGFTVANDNFLHSWRGMTTEPVPQPTQANHPVSPTYSTITDELSNLAPLGSPGHRKYSSGSYDGNISPAHTGTTQFPSQRRDNASTRRSQVSAYMDDGVNGGTPKESIGLSGTGILQPPPAVDIKKPPPKKKAGVPIGNICIILLLIAILVFAVMVTRPTGPDSREAMNLAQSFLEAAIQDSEGLDIFYSEKSSELNLPARSRDKIGSIKIVSASVLTQSDVQVLVNIDYKIGSKEYYVVVPVIPVDNTWKINIDTSDLYYMIAKAITAK